MARIGETDWTTWIITRASHWLAGVKVQLQIRRPIRSALWPPQTHNHRPLNYSAMNRSGPSRPPVSFNGCVGIEDLGTMAPTLVRTFARSGRYYLLS
jgi:hypothetical protein